jgi:hypothetical protein
MRINQVVDGFALPGLLSNIRYRPRARDAQTPIWCFIKTMFYAARAPRRPNGRAVGGCYNDGRQRHLKALMDIPQILDKPTLYHYTFQDSILDVLSARALWARPTWDFPDADEYVFGLKLISAYLKRVHARAWGVQPIPPLTQEMMASYGIDARHVLEQTIAHIEYEVANASKPNLEVYVACVSENKESLEMSRRYGECIIEFGALLPVIGYGYPRPFTAAMLSRVSYDTTEFDSWIMTMGFITLETTDPAHVKKVLDPLNASAREAAMAATTAIALCMHAPNIKKPGFAPEREWRLKTVRSNHMGTVLYANEGSWARELSGTSEDAAFTTHTPPRYIQELTCLGKMNINNVYMLKTVRPEIIAAVHARTRSSDFSAGTRESFLNAIAANAGP